MQYPQDSQGKVSAGDWMCSVKLRKAGVQVSTKEMTETGHWLGKKNKRIMKWVQDRTLKRTSVLLYMAK